MLRKKLKPYDHDLYRFNGSPVKVQGIISLLVELGDEQHIDKHKIDFLVVEVDFPLHKNIGVTYLNSI